MLCSKFGNQPPKNLSAVNNQKEFSERKKDFEGHALNLSEGLTLIPHAMEPSRYCTIGSH